MSVRFILSIQGTGKWIDYNYLITLFIFMIVDGFE